LNTLTAHLTKLLASIRSESYLNYLTFLSTHKGSLWKVTNQGLKDKLTFLPLKNEDGSWAANDQKKEELFQKHLTDVFNKPYETAKNH